MKREALRALDRDREFAAAVLGLAGLTLAQQRQEWRVGAHVLSVTPWLDKDDRYVLLVRSGWPAPAPKSLALAQVYAVSMTGELRDFKRRRTVMRGGKKDSVPKPSPELARWKARAAQEFGMVERPDVAMPTLTPDAPETAALTWKVIESLLQARRVVEEGDDVEAMPLVAPFLARWSGLDEDLLIAGRRWLDRHGYLVRVGELPTAAGKPMVLWQVAQPVAAVSVAADGSLVWPEHGLDGEAAILADAEALVAAGLAEWVE